MNRVGCLPIFLLYLAMGIGVIGVGINGLISIPLDQQGNYVSLNVDQPKQQSSGQQEESRHVLHLATLDGGTLTPLQGGVPFTANGRWSSDGKRFLYVKITKIADTSKSKSALFVSDAPPNPGRKVLETEETILSPSFSPDSNQIAYILSKLSGNENWSSELYVVDLSKDPPEPRLLLQPTMFYVPQVQWSPDGMELLAMRTVEAPSVQTESNKSVSPEIVRVNATTDAVTPVTTLQTFSRGWISMFYSLVWAGDRIFFSSFEPESSQTSSQQIPPMHLYEWSLKEQRKTQLTAGSGLYVLPTLSPSGEQLAYLRMWVDGKIQMGAGSNSEPTDAYVSELYVMDLATKEQKKIAGPSALFQPFWISEESLGYVEFAASSSIVWIQDLKNQTRYDLSNPIKTRFWEEKLKAAQAQQSTTVPTEPKPSSEQMENAKEIEKLRAELSQKEERLQKLEDELNDKQREIQSLKQRIEYQENQISSLRQQVESSQRERRGSNGWIIVTISAALILFIVRLLF